MNPYQFFSWIIVLFLIIVHPVYGQVIQVVTEVYPPYNYYDDKKIVGVSTEVVRNLLKEVDLDAKINVYPWPRAYKMALDEKNTMIYSISRTKERENLFQWVGVVAPANNYLIALKTRNDIIVNKLNDARKYIIGTVLDDVADLYLIKKGFVVGKNIDHANNYELNMKKLIGGRLDLWFSAELVANFLLKKNGYFPQNTIRNVYFLDEISGEGLYVAFSKKTPKQIVDRYQAALAKIKKDGIYDKIMKKYLQ